MQRSYAPVLRGTQKHPVITLLVSVLILGGTVAMTPLLNTNLLGGTGRTPCRSPRRCRPAPHWTPPWNRPKRSRTCCRTPRASRTCS
ncbi:hypothetical protein [Arthrobacter sp. JCM 19049]|uniref:hypothetical protein n=1 Tax=Arthrobacter sp. JCM 19049 TaxID=1460643 RepID=UPI0024363315|nr:hypothetical protein [Arthrobacter sp. JCM 19049]